MVTLPGRSKPGPPIVRAQRKAPSGPSSATNSSFASSVAGFASTVDPKSILPLMYEPMRAMLSWLSTAIPLTSTSDAQKRRTHRRVPVGSYLATKRSLPSANGFTASTGPAPKSVTSMVPPARMVLFCPSTATTTNS
jgi:hypothetical protein